LPGIDLQEEAQFAILDTLADLYDSIPFSKEPKPGFRYFYENPAFSYGDAIFLHTIIRRLAPQRIIEVGSGYSSCVTLDTNEHFFGRRIACTFIEPNPALLKSLLHPNEEIHLVEDLLQNVDLSVFRQLQRGDNLFVDSTHVAKLNSDVNRLFFDILPALAEGVYVHIHDVYYPFEYPLELFEEGRSWNEQYLLRAFLQYNHSFSIRLFSNYLTRFRRDWFAKHAPLVLRNPGGSIWIEKVGDTH
jgi:hypothetical protein